MPDSGSDIKGFRMSDFDTTCPTTGLQCPEQRDLVLQYVGDVDADSDRGLAEENRMKACLKLKEYSLRGSVVTCDIESQLEGSCAIRAVMNESSTRVAAVTLIRGLRQQLISRLTTGD